MPEIISLFSGMGGLDYGFEAAGFSTRVAIEIDSDCCRTLRSNRSWPVIEDDLANVSTKEILKQARLTIGEAAVVVGGPPCQPFSKAGLWVSGKTRKLRDPRANTVREFLRVVEQAQPRVLLLENVAGFASPGRNQGLRFVLSKLKEINARRGLRYTPSWAVVNAANVGVPQMRTRFFLVAERNGRRFSFDRLFPNHPHTRTAWDAIGDLPEPSHVEELVASGKWAELLPSIPEGANYLHHTSRGNGQPLFGYRTRYWSFLLKLSKRLPSWTLQAQPGPATGPFHWNNRRLSMRELCRIQSIPDDVDILGDRLSVQRQAGNAVPALLAEVLAHEIATQLLGQLRDESWIPKLIRPRATNTPRAKHSTAVPAAFLENLGQHPDHPGKGKGPRALTNAKARRAA